jgi:hypothetical protein
MIAAATVVDGKLESITYCSFHQQLLNYDIEFSVEIIQVCD